MNVDFGAPERGRSSDTDEGEIVSNTRPLRDGESEAGEPGDEELMANIAAGDRNAFSILSRRHARRSLALAGRVLGNAADAEEVVQDVFLRIWLNADRWRGGDSRFSTWLYRVVLNRCLDVRRRRTFEPIEDAFEIPAADPDQLTVVSDRQLAKRVRAAIAELPERQRAALSLCCLEEIGCAEAARVMNVSVSAMESLLVRARRAVRSKIGGLARRDDGGGT